MSYKKYRISRDMAWKILIDNNVTKLPVKVTELCNAMGISVRSYKVGAEALRQLNLLERTKTSDGFAIMVRERPLIFYNEKRTPQRNRFTIAHELGHILLGHLSGVLPGDIVIGGPSREPNAAEDPMDPIEHEANVFAGRLIAPACVLWGVGAQSASDIDKLCEIGCAAAEFRWQRIALLYDRDGRMREETGRGCFCTSPLEQAVYNQFMEYIRANKL